MNGISIFIYFAEVVSRVGLWLTGLSGALMAVIAVIGLVSFISSVACDETHERDSAKDYFKMCLKYVWWPFIVFIGSMFIPSKDTMYMIAASEMGEEVLESEEMTKVRTFLNQQLDDLIKDDDQDED